MQPLTVTLRFLEQSSITYIEANAFVSLTKFFLLNLAVNPITYIEAGAFKDMPHFKNMSELTIYFLSPF